MPQVAEEFGVLADDATIERTVGALQRNGMQTHVVASGREAKAKVLALLPDGAQVLNMTSMTLETIGLVQELLESPRVVSVRKRLNTMDRNTQGIEMNQLGGAPEWTIGSVHAVTENGEVFVASNSGSQLGAYAHGAQKVIWVIGAQKIVKDRHEAFRRLSEYSYPLEDERAQKAYGMHSGVSKILIVNKETQPGRITAILVKEKLGF